MTRARCAWLAAVVTTAMLSTNLAFGQTAAVAPAKQTPDPARGQRAGAGRAGRAALPPITANMNQQQLQAFIDTYALMQAKTALQLTEEQVPNFVARLQRLQDIRRRHMAQHRRLMNEMGELIKSTTAGRDEGITAHLQALNDASEGAAVELRKAYQDLDAVLTPWQRGRFRQFEENLERKKIELLTAIGGGRATPPPVPVGGRGR